MQKYQDFQIYERAAGRRWGLVLVGGCACWSGGVPACWPAGCRAGGSMNHVRISSYCRNTNALQEAFFEICQRQYEPQVIISILWSENERDTRPLAKPIFTDSPSRPHRVLQGTLQKSVAGFPATDFCDPLCGCLWKSRRHSVKVGFRWKDAIS